METNVFSFYWVTEPCGIFRGHPHDHTTTSQDLILFGVIKQTADRATVNRHHTHEERVGGSPLHALLFHFVLQQEGAQDCQCNCPSIYFVRYIHRPSVHRPCCCRYVILQYLHTYLLQYFVHINVEARTIVCAFDTIPSTSIRRLLCVHKYIREFLCCTRKRKSVNRLFGLLSLQIRHGCGMWKVWKPAVLPTIHSPF